MSKFILIRGESRYLEMPILNCRARETSCLIREIRFRTIIKNE